MSFDIPSPLEPWKGSNVACVILPGAEDPASLLKRGGLELAWSSSNSSAKVKKFKEQPLKRLTDENLALPDLYLHFLSNEFLVQDAEIDPGCRGGNDNTELHIALPEMYHSSDFPLVSSELKPKLSKVLEFLQLQGDALVSKVEKKPGGFGPKGNFKATCQPNRILFLLKTARPKAPVSLDKDAYGIPQASDLYVFVQNHSSVAFMDEDEVDAFECCIDELQEQGGNLSKLHTFLKIFYEGGFAYNSKVSAVDLAASNGSGSVTSEVSSAYLPKNVGIACMSVVPAFDGQAGIATGYPYVADSRFTPFTETVPVSISSIKDMGAYHQRYGICFTRCVFVWAGEDFERDQALNFTSVLPHGGFFYVPKCPKEHRQIGGLIYAFGESKASLESTLSGSLAL